MAETHEEPRLALAEIHLGQRKKKPTSTSSMPSSPTALRKSSSVKQKCLCSPTTHVGSFRCRYHRANSGLKRNSMSIGSKLSDLASLSSKLSVLSLSKLANVED